MKKTILLLMIVVVSSTIHAQNDSPWKKVDQNKLSISNRNGVKPNLDNKLLFSLDEVAMKQSLLPLQDKIAKGNRITILIPNKKGVLEQFLVWESSNFAPELQAKYPDIRAYAGVGITDKKASINFSFSPNGIQTMVLRADEGSEFIEPYPENKSMYVLFYSKNRNRGDLPFSCTTEDKALSKELLNKASEISANNRVFKTLRLALSCTGEYATYFGGTVSGALAGMNKTMTRVNAILNKDLAVKLEIISNNASIMYTNAITDPYSDSTAGVGGAWNQELQDNLSNVIGNGGYDIGHLFGAAGGGGNAGCIGCVCVNPSLDVPLGKGSAFTSPSDSKPEGDTFDIDFVAHEMGHQLGANHTFSYSIEDTGVSVEPGSGSTIMGYAGITTDYDVQPNSDDYFAYASINQIQTNLLTKTCPVSTITTNSPPVIDAGLDWTIPYGTPFILKGTGSDINGDVLTYCWEENDSATTQSGANSTAIPTKPNGPLFRSILPSSSKIRYMPAYSSVLSNKLTTIWESVATVARTLHFTLTGRDNAAEGNAQTNTDEMIVNVSGTVGPFAVTSQNTDNLSWFQGTSQTVTWSVNGSAALTGSSTVNIKLSTDGGLTFPTTLAGATPNDGSQTITVPNFIAKNCRILIEPTGNIFYALNSKAFAIGYSVTSSCNTYTFNAPFAIPESASYTTRAITVPASTGAIANVSLAVGFTHSYLSDVQIDVVGPQGPTVKLFERSCGTTSNTLLLNYDDQGNALSCSETAVQNVTPYEPLAVFNGQNPAGVWTFRIRDAFKGDVGTLNSASITICTQTYTLAAPEFEINDFVLYPNPNKGNFNVQFTSKSSTGIKVLVNDLLGRKIFEKEFENNANFNENIQLKNAQAGIYLLTVVDGERKQIKKIVVE
ncbi:subtilisin-like proprotein convertase family protein [Flavobacterium sp. CG_9.10]|uniref:zinc-dependent metalloprotease n=1 Tax=Flavobacterium sp. CG_9.10 TaxID=2787729 RepID=UPI0018C99006|nr:zinc-dependent metalloprotease family protein [Flavobacterium sp. CG_9.10]MBG6110847.1 subtilisin-like proprotein convertase family protein [Flavobacterium sp. CG_9.10]